MHASLAGFACREEEEAEAPCLVLCGPTGCGKTASVYVRERERGEGGLIKTQAACEALGLKIIETNSSEERSGEKLK